jgi:hypothetical protein
MDKQYLRLNYDVRTKNYPVTFNNVEYNVDHICIYFPSLHNFNNEQIPGEIIIYHNGTNSTKLNVCIPLSIASGTSCPLLNNILNEVVSRQIVDNYPHDLSLDVDYNINSFVKYAPYYYYLDDRTHFIVYGLSDGILITKQLWYSMTSIITEKMTQLPYISNLNYNEKGPYNDGSDEIYIDCQPVDSDGNLLIDKYNKDFYKNFNIGSDASNTSIIVISVLVAVILLFIAFGLFDITSILKKLSGQTLGIYDKEGSKTALPTSETIASRGFLSSLNNIFKLFEQKPTLTNVIKNAIGSSK